MKTVPPLERRNTLRLAPPSYLVTMAPKNRLPRRYSNTPTYANPVTRFFKFSPLFVFCLNTAQVWTYRNRYKLSFCVCLYIILYTPTTYAVSARSHLQYKFVYVFQIFKLLNIFQNPPFEPGPVQNRLQKKKKSRIAANLPFMN